ncbi:electron transfer flavoprotein [candidate division GN15 bacterium]|uniref:Electron transfer flavoprotein-ubiquinone oxidoreductase n=1 Tax=candidate division GN15 bacterium TaxID=2072418 RepID=A0A855WX50_9BACT|nr:MAG: electron transfer flavoprotein [candidate division GN15 bacterium]
MAIERDTLETDILIVGAGPAGLSFAYKLAQLLGGDSSAAKPEILFMEKGSYVGAHALSGAVMDPRGIAELIPDFREKGAPLEAAVSGDSFYLLSEKSAIKSPVNPPPLQNHGSYVISLNKFTGWLAQQVEAAGIDIYAGMAGFELLVEEGKVTGVQTVDMGLDKDGTPKSNFEPGSIVRAKVTVLCEGVHGSLTRQAFEKIPSLREHCQPQSYLTGVKEVWEVPAGRIKAGQVMHTVGWPQPHDQYGGGWIYGMSDTMVSVGYCVGLDSYDPTNDPHLKFQLYKTHPLLRRILEGGTMLHYGAKTMPDAGYYSIPKLYHDGLMLCGDSAGLMNPQRLKGIHLAIKSGMMAAETAFEAVKKQDYSATVLKGYQERFDTSWAREEVYRTRNVHAGFKGGLYAGLFHSAMQLVTGGRGLFDRREHKRDHEYMLTIEAFKARFGREPKKPQLTFDNKYTYDKLTDVYKSGTMHEEHQPSHLVIADYDICNNRCTQEYGNPCQHFCPASVYNMVDDEARPGKKKLELTPSNCVHCKTCDIADPYQVIRWVTPQGGEGPNYTDM